MGGPDHGTAGMGPLQTFIMITMTAATIRMMTILTLILSDFGGPAAAGADRKDGFFLNQVPASRLAKSHTWAGCHEKMNHDWHHGHRTRIFPLLMGKRIRPPHPWQVTVNIQD
jgi:hypothetical protein